MKAGADNYMKNISGVMAWGCGDEEGRTPSSGKTCEAIPKRVKQIEENFKRDGWPDAQKRRRQLSIPS